MKIILILLYVFILFPFTASTQPFTEISAGLEGVWGSSVAWGDYDSDGDLDILLTGQASGFGNVSKIYRNDTGNFVEISTALNGVEDCSAAWGDYDNDGDLDILLTGNTGSARISKVYRNVSGLYADISAPLTGVFEGSGNWGDYDNDGDLDILLTGDTGSSGVSEIYRNDGGNFVDIFAGLIAVRFGKSSSAWGDYDNDGDLDILLAGQTTSGSYISKVYRNDSGSFVDISANLIGIADGSVAWGDYDSDGDLDILLTGDTGSGNSTKLYRNDGGIFIDTFVPIIGVNRQGSAVWGDYDNDGDLDILLAGWTGSIYSAKVYRNDGSTFADISATLSEVMESSVAWGDYDKDGDLDILLTGYSFGSIISKIYRNDTGTPNTPPSIPTNLTSSVSGNSVLLSWSKSTDTETPPNGLTYNLRIGSTPGGSEIVSPMADLSDGYRRIPKIGNTSHSNSWTIKNLPPATYYWSAQAIDNAFAGSAFATEQSFVLSEGDKTPPDAPIGLVATPGDGRVDLTWNPNPEPDVVRYRIYRGGTVVPSLLPLDSVDVTITTYTDLQVTNGVAYVYRITAVDSGSNESRFSDPAEATPTGVTASITVISPNGGEFWRVGTTHAIEWVSDLLTADVTVNIEYSTDIGATWTLITAGTDNDGAEDWVIPNTPSSDALVRLSDAAGLGISDASDATFAISDVPQRPENFQVGFAPDGLLIEWAPVPDPTVVAYTLHRDVNPFFIPNQFNRIAVLAHPESTYFDPYEGLKSLTEYFYVIAAIDSDNKVSDFSITGERPVFLLDPRGYVFDMDTYGGAFVFGSNHSYDRFYDMKLDSGSIDFRDSDDMVDAEDGAREYIFVNDNLKGLQVIRKIFVPRVTGGFARILDIYRNISNTDVSFNIQQVGNHGADFNFNIVATSDGDRVVEANTDLYVVTAGDSAQGDLALAHVFNGPAARHKVDFIDLYLDQMNFYWENVTVPFGESIAYLYFEVQDSSSVRAIQAAEQVIADPSKFTFGMSPEELRIVRNFSLTNFAGPKISINKTAISYGSLGLGNVADSILVISNIGSSTLDILDQTITGANPDEFSIVTGGGSVSIAPGEGHSVVIRFQPTTIGDKEAVYSVQTNDPSAVGGPIVSLSGNGLDASGPPAPIDLQSSTGANWSAANSFQLAWTNPSDPSGIAAVHYKIGAEPAGPYDTTRTVAVASVNSIDVSIPEPAAAGAYDVFVWLRDGAGNVADPTDPNNRAQTVLRFDNVPPSFGSHTPPATGTILQPITIVASASDGHSGIASITLQYRDAGALWSTAKELPLESGSAIIPGGDVRAVGVDYRIIATDNVGNSDTLRNGNLDFFSIPILVLENVATTRITTRGGTAVTDFRMVSVPLNLREKRASVVFSVAGSYGQDWRLWTFDGGLSESAWRQHSSSNEIQIEPGRGYFLLTRSSVTINNGEGFTISLSEAAKGNVPRGWELKSGWNFVGNPFLADIPLAGLKLASAENLSAQNVYYFSGLTGSGWTNAAASLTLRVKDGLAIRVNSDTKLLLRTTEGLSKDGFAKQSSGEEDPFGEVLQPDEWLLRITARDGVVADDLNYLGVKRNASVGFDQYDWYEPPTLPGAIALYFRHDEWEQRGAYASDIRPATEEGYVWEFTISGTPNSFVNAHFEPLSKLPETFQAYAVLPDNKMVYDIRRQPSFDLATLGGSRKIRVLVGTSDFVRLNSNGLILVPTSFVLHQNYPNPFNASTTIRYELPVQARVTLKIYSILGEEIASLVEADQPAGYYETRWDAGSGAASGVYFFRLNYESSGSKVFGEVRKMILVK